MPTLETSQASKTTTDSHAPSYELCIAVLPRNTISSVSTELQFPLYWLSIERETLSSQERTELEQICTEILTERIAEDLWCCEPQLRVTWINRWQEQGFNCWAEKQFYPGVTDNLGKTVEEAFLLYELPYRVRVASGAGLLIAKVDAADSQAIEKQYSYHFFHPLVEKFIAHNLKQNKTDEQYKELLCFPEVLLPSATEPQTISLDLSDQELIALSSSRVLALSLEEMRAIKSFYASATVRQERKTVGLPSDPTDVELEVIAQTWSEHCKHKIFNAEIEHSESTGGAGTGVKKQLIDGLYGSYIKEPTKQLQSQRTDLLSVFKDNSGVIRWSDKWAICFKVETHNSPSALEPYGGALTGILGVNRDVLGTGLGAKPICNTDIFCFAYPHAYLPERPRLLPACAIVAGVRKGVQDGGNKSGIPTVNGAIYFNDSYRAKPLVFCGTVGILPMKVNGRHGYEKYTSVGDTIVMAGGRVGKDGIHGATFSSEALHENSPHTAVQIGDPFTQKRLIDFILEARDEGLITGITDNGAGGLSSSVGEMAQMTNGAILELDHIPLKYPGLLDYEIVVSESQERMTLSTDRFDRLAELAKKHNVEVTQIGRYCDHGYFEVTRAGKRVAYLPLNFLHDGCPKMKLQSSWQPAQDAAVKKTPGVRADLKTALLALLAHPNICSREEVIRQYDHEVQGASVIKPLMGLEQKAPCDAAVITPILGQSEGLAISNGLCPALAQYDPELMAICAVDEAVRNLVSVGADPNTIVLLDNFCWPDPIASVRNPEGQQKLGQLVKACKGLSAAVMAYSAPLISGKDSMKNDFDDGVVRLSILPTLLVSALGRVPDIQKSVTMEFKLPGDAIYLLAAGTPGLSGSVYESLVGTAEHSLPSIDLEKAARMYKLLFKAIQNGWVRSCHDVSDGGLAVALAESVIGSEYGANITMPVQFLQLFGEGPASLVVSVDPAVEDAWEKHWKDFGIMQIGQVCKLPELSFLDKDDVPIASIGSSELLSCWQTKLPLENE
jgi:phosphoribosylformylglycinamidine synthase subunit PurSL